MKQTIEELHYLQSLPLKSKVSLTKQRLREWVNHYGVDGVYISFSGGKDSTVLLTIARDMYPDIKAVFVDTGLEFPEIREFVKTFDNVDWIKPKKNFKQVINECGYPFISKEVSESVYGARRYLEEITRSIDRQTDRQTDRQRYSYYYDKVCGLGKYAKNEWGGYDNKYRKLRGICEYAKREDAGEEGRKQSEIGTDARNVHQEEGHTDTGEYP